MSYGIAALKRLKGEIVMKRVSVLIYLFLFLIIISSCSNKNEEVNFDIYDSLFIDSFSNRNDIEDKNITSLTAYYYDTRYFYDVSYTHEINFGSHEIEMLYVYRYNSLKKFFNIENEEECYQYFSDYYTYFLEAQEKGIKKEYTNEEIQAMVNNFYGQTME